jgi:o-succinylbenzoate---CoA ligase
MQDWLTARANATPRQIALVHNDQTWTYAELNALTARLAHKLRDVGVRPGLRVGMLMPNNPAAIVTVHAITRLHAELVPLNGRLTAREMNWQLKQANVKLLLYTSATTTAAAALNPNRFEVNLANLPGNQHPANKIDLDAVQAIVFTSGTSGQPKGAEITFGNHFYSATASAFRLGHHLNDRWLSVLPLYHVGGLAVIFRTTLYGITVVLHERFTTEAVTHSFTHHNITMISLVPTMLYRLLEADTAFPASLRLLLLGGAAATPDLLERTLATNLPIAPTYGLTEATSQVATTTPQEARRKPGSVGKPLMFTSVQIVDDNGQPQPPNEYGEIVVRGPTIMRGYLRNPEATAKTLRNGALYTGDIGYLDDDGNLFLVQRRSDLIISGGENVYPAEVENILRAHPAVREVTVVGINHPEWGQQVVAAVIPSPNQTLTADELTAFARNHIAGYKLPRQILFVDTLPQTASGKIQRAAVRDLFK